jgi:hydroxymethylglutaryl-CoA lyase
LFVVASIMAQTNAVRIVEVGPRDGLQNITSTVLTSVKIELIQRLSSTGLQVIEATSFVSPKWIPQLADAREVTRAILPLVQGGAVAYPVLVPNLAGLEAAVDAGVREIGVFISAAEGFSRKNINCSIAESLERVRRVTERALPLGIRVRGLVEPPFQLLPIE